MQNVKRTHFHFAFCIFRFAFSSMGDCPNFRVSENGTVPFAAVVALCPPDGGNFRLQRAPKMPVAYQTPLLPRRMS